jgi:SAM-dependent methyltransferase
MNLLASLHHRDCPVCGETNRTAVEHMRASLDEGRLTSSSFSSRKTPEFMSYRLVRCAVCATVYASEAPSAAALAKAYHAADYDSAEEAALAAAVYGAALAPFLSNLPARGIALEIGAGTGVFLRHLREAGFEQAVGIEPSPAAIGAATADVRPWIREGVFKGDEFPPGSVSLVCCFQTLEHVSEPRKLVETAYRMLEPGGMIALITHDYTAPINRALGRRSPIIDIEHLQLFCPASMRRLTGSAGFKAVSVGSIRNVYPLSYWLALLPLPGALKQMFLAAATATKVARARIGLNVGNLLTVAQKPAAAP